MLRSPSFIPTVPFGFVLVVEVFAEREEHNPYENESQDPNASLRFRLVDEESGPLILTEQGVFRMQQKHTK